MKKILIIKAHPREKSFCNTLTEKYIAGAKEVGHEIKVLNLCELNLEKFLKFGYTENPILTEDLMEAQKQITWSDHLVFSYPIWWSTPPALLKVFLEVVFASGFAYKYQQSKGFIPKWDKLLLGKSARLISTMDSPSWYYSLFLQDPAFKMMHNNLNFCGIKPVKKNYFGSVKMSSEKQKIVWLEKIYAVGLAE